MSSIDPQKMMSETRRVRYLGAAHSGVRAAWHMKLTSLALLPLSVGCVFLVLSLVGKSYAEVHATLSHPLPSLLLLLFILAGIYHMLLGMRTIIEDYVQGHQVRELCLAANAFFCMSVALACVFAVLRLSFV